MAHEIETTDNLFSVRSMPWHGLGTVLEGYPTRVEAQKIALPWEPVTEPIYRRVPTFDAQGNPAVEYREVPGQKAVVRDDNGADLGVVGEGYEPVTNTELFDIGEAIQGEGADVRFETAGSLRGGRKVWLLLRLNEPIVVPGDPNGATVAYYALQNSHDGSGSLRGQGVNTRIVCANTSSWADMEAARSGMEFTFRHTKSVRDRIEDAKAALAGWRTSVDEWLLIQEHLVGVKVTREQQEAFVEAFCPAPAAKIVSPRVMTNIENARASMWDILNGETSEGVAATAYGLVQASVEYAQHYRRSQGSDERARIENKFTRSMLTKSDLTRQAMRIVREVANV